MKPIFFSEQVPQKNDINLKNNYEFRDFYEVRNGLITFKMCGFTIIENHLITVLPKGVLEKDDVFTKEDKARLLLRVLSKYEKNAVKNKNLYNGTNRKRTAKNLFSSILEIIRDYQHYGILETRFKKLQINGNGKVNWSKSFKQQTPVMQNNQMFYLDLVTEKKLKNIAEEITYIHWHILKEIEMKFGWLFGFKVTTPPVIPYKKINTTKARITLKKAMNLIFNKHELQRYKLLYDYLTENYLNQSQDIAENKLLFAFKFDMIWEEICKQILTHQEELMVDVPKYKWEVREHGEVYRYQKPDILINDRETLYIIDAKYYTFNVDGKNHLPGGPDMGKQFLYLKSMESIKKYKKLYNIFIVPANNEKEVMTYYAKGYLDNIRLQEMFEYIHTIQLDSISAMEHYLKGKKELREELLNIVMIKEEEL